MQVRAALLQFAQFLEAKVPLLRSVEARYVLVGGISFALNFVVFSALLFSGLWYVYSTVIAGTLVWMFNFPMHKGWTFGDWNLKRAPLQGTAHFCLKLWNTYLADPFLLYYFVEAWLWHPLLGKVAIGVMLGAQNFLLCRYVIFRRSA